MADTYSKSSAEFSLPRALISGFWKALCVTVAMQFLFYHTGGIGFTVFVCIAVYFRQKLRQMYGLPNMTGSVLAMDCLYWCFCPCCTIAQETRQVQFVTGRDVKNKSIPSLPQTTGTMRYGY
jgi:Cys-rich protein (TIGR01571 family)